MRRTRCNATTNRGFPWRAPGGGANSNRCSCSSRGHRFRPGAVPEDPMTAMVVEVVAVVAVALGKATMIGPVTVAVVMAAVAIEGLGIATTIVGERARAARDAA